MDPNFSYNFLPKRAPQGFMGMRGKKYFQNEWNAIQDDLNYDKRSPQGFLGM